METMGGLHVRVHGNDGPTVIVLHGGPAAAGSAGRLAVGLADVFRVLEPWQRGSGEEPLTVARHVEDLHELVVSQIEAMKPALVGHSWGAMLALAYAAAHPESVGPVVLVGSGTFDPESRARMKALMEERKTDDLRRRLERLSDEIADPTERFCKYHELCDSLSMFDRIPVSDGALDEVAPPFDKRAHAETWEDMLRLQEEGIYPSAFSTIVTPVIMLHGEYDPHPGRMIYANLMSFLPQLEYREFERCGHEPWAERYARDDFFSCLRDWLSKRSCMLRPA